MKSILSVYKIGHGPSSSHTVGPYNAAKEYRRRYPDADRIDVTLFGSLAFTGAGHGTEKAIRSAIPEATVHSDRENRDLPHPNTMLFSAYRDDKLIDSTRIFSIGGGSIRFEGEDSDEERVVYPEAGLTEMLEYCRENGMSFRETDCTAARITPDRWGLR